MMTNWDKKFCELAEYISTWSKDPNTKIGAVIMGYNKEPISFGYNGIPRGVDDSPSERSSRTHNEKYYWYEHAERNAIYNAARIGIPTLGKIMYLNCCLPCADCARAIIQSGIKRVVCKKGVSNRVIWDLHMIRSKKLFKEASVEITYY